MSAETSRWVPSSRLSSQSTPAASGGTVQRVPLRTSSSCSPPADRNSARCCSTLSLRWNTVSTKPLICRGALGRGRSPRTSSQHDDKVVVAGRVQGLPSGKTITRGIGASAPWIAPSAGKSDRFPRIRDRAGTGPPRLTRSRAAALRTRGIIVLFATSEESPIYDDARPDAAAQGLAQVESGHRGPGLHPALRAPVPPSEFPHRLRCPHRRRGDRRRPAHPGRGLSAGVHAAGRADARQLQPDHRRHAEAAGRRPARPAGARHPGGGTGRSRPPRHHGDRWRAPRTARSSAGLPAERRVRRRGAVPDDARTPHGRR